MPETEGKKPLVQRLSEDASSVIAELIYEKVNSLLGAGDQLFTMEFPARPLNPNTYRYDADNTYSSLTKPITVAEAEFNLADALYDTAPIVQAGNGEKLSTVYSTLLNNYVPKMEFLKDFVMDKNHLREWLLEEVSDVIYDENQKVVSTEAKTSRMELCKKLYGIYLEERNKWYKEKNERFNESKNDENLLEEYARWVSSEGLVRDEELNNFFNDAVVRGNYHEVMTILGFLNVESPAETLEKTKQNMRACEKRALDGSGSFYPVQMQPADWFKALEPNLHPKDLTMSTEALIAEYRAKKKELKLLEQKLAELEQGEISPDELKKKAERVKVAKRSLAEAEQKAVAQYGNGALEAFRMAIKIFRTTADPVAKFTDAVAEFEKIENPDNKDPISAIGTQLYTLLEDCSKEAIAAMEANFKNVCDMSTAVEDAVSAQADYAAAQVQNMTSLKNSILSQMDDVRADINYLAPLVSGTLAEQAAPSGDVPSSEEAEKNAALLPENTIDTSDSTFMDVILSSETIVNKVSNNTTEDASQSNWKVGGWFFGASHSNNQADTKKEEQKKADASKIEIGFRVMKVSIDRGQWFSPNVFKMTQNFYHLSESRCAPGINKDMICNALAQENPDTALKELLTYKVGDVQCNYLLTSYPTAFVIAKDITIRVKVEASEMEENKAYVESQSSTAGGCFGFSASSASNSKNRSASSYVGNRNGFIYIRIPGPQILGWFQQLVSLDVSEIYAPMEENLYENVLLQLNPSIEDKGESEE